MNIKKSYIALSILVFIYLIFRAIYVPLAHDELATFYYYIQPFQFNPFTNAHGDANNHILNSIFSGISFKLFGFSSLSIRLVNLLTFIPFAIFVYKIGEFLNNNITKAMFYLGMLLTVNFIQFFAMSRGYGISMAFLIVAFYYTLKLYKEASWLKVALAFFSLLVALFANLSVMYLVLITICIIGLTILLNLKQYLANKYHLALVILSFVGVVIGLKVAIDISFFLKENGLLYYGTLDGFWVLTITSMLDLLFENKELFIQVILGISIVFLLVVYGVNLWKDKLKVLTDSRYMFFFMLVGVVCAIQIAALFLHNNYPEDRVALYLLPLFMAALSFGVDGLKQANISRLALLPIALIVGHFFFGANMDRISIWPQDSMPDRYYEIVKNYDNKTKYPSNVAGYALRGFTYTNKVYRDGGNENMIQLWTSESFDSLRNLVVKNHPAIYADFLISDRNDIKAIGHLYDSIDYDPICKHLLLKRKQPVKKEFFIKKESLTSHGVTKNEYVELIRQEYDSLGVEGLLVGLDLKITSTQLPFKGRVVADITNKTTGERIQYDYFALDWLRYSWKKKDRLVKSFYLYNLPQLDNVEVLIYIWNLDKKPVEVIEGELEIFKVKM
jgi:hypothetical protein